MNVSNSNYDAGVNDILDEELKKNFAEVTDLKNMEQLKSDLNAKPESTMHKVGRFLSGILGGLLVAAGIAVAAVATCGIGVGVAAAGIGLIATSVALRPKNPGATAQQLDLQGMKPDPYTGDDGTLSLTGMGRRESPAILKALATKYGVEPKNIPHESETGRRIGVLLTAIAPDSLYVDKEFATPFEIKSCVKGILSQNGVTEFEANEKNFLLVRHAIDAFFAQVGGVLKEEDAAALNSSAVKEGFEAILETEIRNKKLSRDSEDYKLFAIFKGALKLESVELAKPQQNPEILNDIDENLIGEPEIKTVSLQEQAPKIPPKDISFVKGSEKAIMDDIHVIDPKFKLADDFEGDKDGSEQINKMMKYSDFKEGEVDLFDTTPKDFVENVLTGNNINNFELTPKNVLIVRCTMARFFELNKAPFGWSASRDDVLNKFNTPEGQKQIYDNITKKMEQCKPGDKDYKLYAIFRAAVSATDLSNLNPDKTLLEVNQYNNMLA